MGESLASACERMTGTASRRECLDDVIPLNQGISVESWLNGCLMTIAVAHTRASALGFLTRDRTSAHHCPITGLPPRIVSPRTRCWAVYREYDLEAVAA